MSYDFKCVFRAEGIAVLDFYKGGRVDPVLTLTVQWINSGTPRGIICSAALKTQLSIYHASFRVLGSRSLHDKPDLQQVNTAITDVFSIWGQEETLSQTTPPGFHNILMEFQKALSEVF